MNPRWPRSRVRPQLVQPLLNAFPKPNGPDLGNGTAGFSAGYSDPSSLNAGSIRIDYLATNKITIFGRYNDAPSNIAQRGLRPVKLQQRFEYRLWVPNRDRRQQPGDQPAYDERVPLQLQPEPCHRLLYARQFRRRSASARTRSSIRRLLRRAPASHFLAISIPMGSSSTLASWRTICNSRLI